MDALPSILLAAAWLAILALLLWGAWRALRAMLADEAELPFFEVLRRRKLTTAQIEDGRGVTALVGAVRRCALCAGKGECRAELAADPLADPAGDGRFDCPNAALLRGRFAPASPPAS